MKIKTVFSNPKAPSIIPTAAMQNISAASEVSIIQPLLLFFFISSPLLERRLKPPQKGAKKPLC